MTLTYRRDEYADALDLYRRTSEEQHVPLFMRRLGRALGRSLTGKWLCKLEFQSGGWVHFHIVLLGLSFADHKLVERCWSHGFVWVKRLNRQNCMYLTKYVAKDGRIPARMYGERPRSFKCIRVSSGFWGEERKPSSGPGEADYLKYGPGPLQSVDGYVPIGVKLRQGRGVVIKSNVGCFSIKCDPGEFLGRFVLGGGECVGQRGGWMWFRGVVEDVWRVAAACREHRSTASGKRASERTGTPPPPGGGLHLKGTSNPDVVLPEWLEAVYREEAEGAYV